MPMSPGISSDPLLLQRIEGASRRRLADELEEEQSRELDRLLAERERASLAGSALGGRSQTRPQDINLDAPLPARLPVGEPEVPQAPEFSDVQAGGSSTAQVIAPEMPGPPQPPPDRLPTESYIRYSLAGGTEPREEVRAFGQRFTKAQAPDPSTFQDYKPGSGSGTVSMMTAPENVDEVTFASRMDELERRMAEDTARRDLEDPMWRERAKAGADIERALTIEEGKARIQSGRQQESLGGFLDRAAPYQQEIDQHEQTLAQIRQSPEYQAADPQRRQVIEDQFGAKISNARARLRLLQQAFGFATGEVPASLFQTSPPGFDR